MMEGAHQALRQAARHVIDCGAIGVAGVIDVPGRERLRFAEGVGDVERGTALTGGERFFAASQTKMLTAAAVLCLAIDGRLKLDDRVGALWPGATLAGVPDNVTVAQLLTHRSGIGNFSDFVQGALPPTYISVPPPSVGDDDLLLLGRVRGPQFAPGTAWAYNNTGYIVLGRIVEILSGQSCPAFIADRLLESRGMSSTSFGRDGWSTENLCEGYVEPYGQRGGKRPVSSFADLSVASSAGDMISTLDDLVIWLRSLVSATPPGGPQLSDFLGEVVNAWEAGPDWMVAPRYAYGIEEVVLGGRAMWGHMGATIGYRSGSFICPASGLVVALFMTFVHRPDPMMHLALQAKRQELMSMMSAIGSLML